MFAINTKTLNDFKEIIEWAFNQGMSWRDGSTHDHSNFWEEYGSETCVVIDDMEITYCHCTYFIGTYKKVLSMEQFRKRMNKYYMDRFKEKYDLR